MDTSEKIRKQYGEIFDNELIPVLIRIYSTLSNIPQNKKPLLEAASEQIIKKVTIWCHLLEDPVFWNQTDELNSLYWSNCAEIRRCRDTLKEEDQELSHKRI